MPPSLPGYVTVPPTPPGFVATTPPPVPVTASFEIIPQIPGFATLPPSGRTPKPFQGTSSFVTTEGPPFLSFRRDLTDIPFMFTPMDLSVNGTYAYPLIADAAHVVGSVSLTVQSGMVTASCWLIEGVKLDKKNEFMTFFPDIRDIPSVDPADLQGVKHPFDVPVSPAAFLAATARCCYINMPVSYNSKMAGLQPFSFKDPAYLERISVQAGLMD